jgi:hypothetical protein
MILEAIVFYHLNYIKPEYECVRWTWYGDVYDRRVVCLHWKHNKKEKQKDKK